uniref:Uncharacterized protein n=1 Tax=Rhizophora mucronata TaxID=61149 RepID=A0A2P2NZZ9_RHIMU
MQLNFILKGPNTCVCLYCSLTSMHTKTLWKRCHIDFKQAGTWNSHLLLERLKQVTAITNYKTSDHCHLISKQHIIILL